MGVYRGHEKKNRTGYTIGHEFTGEILFRGSRVRKFRVGDKVISPFTTYVISRLGI
jgi:threonine dehydrogenase-like Zn-dependent dehydrogenase